MLFLDETRNLKETSLQTHINSLRAFFGWLTMEEKIKKNPMSKIKSIKIDKVGARQALTVEELERLRDACVTYREKGTDRVSGFLRLPSERGCSAVGL